MKFNPRKTGLVLGLLSISVLTACGTTGVAPNSQVFETPSNTEFMQQTAEERNTTLANIAAEDREISRLNETLYAAGRPVHYGDGRSGYTVIWARQLNQILFFPGHTTGAFGQESQAIMVLAADGHGRPVLRGGVPVVISASASHQEGLGRFMARGGFQVLGAAFNGAIAAQIRADATCKENCGGPANVVQIQTNATAEAVGTGTATATSGRPTCTTCTAYGG